MAKRVTSGGTTSTFWLHKDRLGSVQAITDSAGAEVFRKKYRPYGETLAQSGSNTESLGWISERNDSETGFTYLHARYYSCGLGVFLSPDPLHPETQGVGVHRYGYGLGNPIGAIDRSGLASCAVADLVKQAPDCSDSCSAPKNQLLAVVQPARAAIAELTLQPAVAVLDLATQKGMAITQMGCVDGSCVSKLAGIGATRRFEARAFDEGCFPGDPGWPDCDLEDDDPRPGGGRAGPECWTTESAKCERTWREHSKDAETKYLGALTLCTIAWGICTAATEVLSIALKAMRLA